MGSGTGNNFFEDVLDVGTNLLTGGLAGFDDGGFGAGVTVEGVKEVTGVNAAEDALIENRRQFELQREAAIQERADEQALNAREAVNLSRSAATRSSSSVAARRSGSRFSSLGSDERDFLGL